MRYVCFRPICVRQVRQHKEYPSADPYITMYSGTLLEILWYLDKFELESKGTELQVIKVRKRPKKPEKVEKILL